MIDQQLNQILIARIAITRDLPPQRRLSARRFAPLASISTAHEKLLNRRIRADALTTAPSFVCRHLRDHRAESMPFDYGLAIGHKNF
jgi:hypothetical protein